jgi:ribulose-phosphate 3-epimerase
MISAPERFIADFVKAGADLITVQVEACVHLNRTLQMIRAAGIQCGAVLNPATPLETLEWVLEDLDLVMLMSVNPGFGGQSFIPNTIERIRRLRQTIADRGLNTLIEVDGGVNADTVGPIAAAGADVFVAGSAIFGSADYAATIADLRRRIATASA